MKLFEHLKNLFKPVEQPAGLISALLDESNIDRDEAAESLADYDQEEVELALAKVVFDPKTDESMAGNCGETLAIIWCRKGRINHDILKRLQGFALRLAVGVIKTYKPEWEREVRQTLKHDPRKAEEWDKA